jgi:hypothetical protein
MNLLVSDNDVTSDKDYKHVMKHMCKLFLHKKGVMVYGTKVTMNITKHHLRLNGNSFESVEFWTKPNDHQDVLLTLLLCSAIWDLPEAGDDYMPTLCDGHEALWHLGCLLLFIFMLYINIMLSLPEQLEYLSAGIHLAMDLYIHSRSGGSFMPNQLFSDIAIMVKNVYFCMAKALLDDPNGEFYIMLLGTDRLEISFAILCTMVGNDANADCLQLQT